MKSYITILYFQIRQFVESPILFIFILAPVLLIFILGQSLSVVFTSDSLSLSGMDYFAITILTMAIMNGGFLAAWGIQREHKENTILRLKVSPVSPFSHVLGIVTASGLVLFFLSLCIILILSLFLNINFGTDILTVFILIAALCAFATSLGIFFASLSKDDRIANGLLNTFVPLIVFLGGGYFPVPETGVFHTISVISPLRWINLALKSEIHLNSSDYTLKAIVFCLVVSAVLTFFILMKIKKEGLR